MEANNQATINNLQKLDISSLSINKSSLERLLRKLQERADSAIDIEISNYEKGAQSDEVYEANIETIRTSAELKLHVDGPNGESVWGSIDDVFNSPNLPEEIVCVYCDSSNTLKNVYNYTPRNRFSLFLDFRKPNPFNFSLMPSAETPNDSNFEVNGLEATWVNGVFTEVKNFLETKKSLLSIVHRHSVYDGLLWLLGLPLAFWSCSLASPLMKGTFLENNIFIHSAAYLYTALLTVFVFRVLFHYLRWVCPLVEYKWPDSKIMLHRGCFATLALGWLGTFVYNLISLL